MEEAKVNAEVEVVEIPKDTTLHSTSVVCQKKRSAKRKRNMKRAEVNAEAELDVIEIPKDATLCSTSDICQKRSAKRRKNIKGVKVYSKAGLEVAKMPELSTPLRRPCIICQKRSERKRKMKRAKLNAKAEVEVVEIPKGTTPLCPTRVKERPAGQRRNVKGTEVKAEAVTIQKDTTFHPTCVVCQSKKSCLWRRDMEGEYTCRRCTRRQHKSTKPKRPPPRKTTRARSARMQLTKAKEICTAKSRRTLLFKKKRPKRALMNPPEVITCECVLYNNQYYEVGDVVSMVTMDGRTIYGQIYGLVIDEFGEKSAYLTWLKRIRGKGIFNPADYIFDIDDGLPRKLSFLTYIARYPLNVFRQNLLYVGSNRSRKIPKIKKRVPGELVLLERSLKQELALVMK